MAAMTKPRASRKRITFFLSLIQVSSHPKGSGATGSFMVRKYLTDRRSWGLWSQAFGLRLTSRMG